MARLGGMGAESFSARDHLSASGLGSILRDQKNLPVAASRANVLLGFAQTPAQSVPKTPVRSLGSSPIESSMLEDEELDDFKEEDVWAAESRTWQDVAKGVERSKTDLHRQSIKEDLGFGFSDIGKQRLNPVEAARPRRRTGLDKASGLTDAFAAVGAMGLAPLSRVAEIQSGQATGRPTPSRLPTASRMIPQSVAVNETRRHLGEHQSAPVNVPNWSKTIGVNTKLKKIDVMQDDQDEDDERLPPHELLAREYARSQTTSFSVCEGQGRTLKGRDLSRVRNAVWSKIGFAD